MQGVSNENRKFGKQMKELGQQIGEPEKKWNLSGGGNSLVPNFHEDLITGRERILKTIKGEKTDRVPICPFIYYNLIYEHYDVETPNFYEFQNPSDFDVIKKTIDVHEYYGFDIIHRLGSVWNAYDVVSEGENWTVKREKTFNGGGGCEITRIRTPEKELKQVKEFARSSKYLIVESISEHFIKTPEDLTQFIKYQPEDISLDCSSITRTRKVLGEKGVTCAFSKGAFNMLNLFRKLDDLLMDPYVDEGFFREMIRYFTERLKRTCKLFIAAGAELIFYGANMANGTTFGPENFKKYVLEYEKDFLEFIRNQGAYSLYHNCGDAKSLLDVYRELPFDAYETLTPPPFGDMIFEEALEKFNKNVTLLGNIDQVDFLKTATPGEVYGRVKEIVQKGKARGRFILSTSDYIFENTPLENIKAFVDAGLKYGAY